MMMFDRTLDCLVDGFSGAELPVHAVAASALEGFLAQLPAAQAAFLRQSGFAAKAGAVALLPGDAGVAGAVFGLGDKAEPGPAIFGALPSGLPPGTVWRLGSGFVQPEQAVLGWCLGAYRFAALRAADARVPARLAIGAGESRAARRAAHATWLVRDLVNCPANRLGPAELAQAAGAALAARGVEAQVASGEALERDYPAVAAVGRGSARAPCVLTAHWQGSAAGPQSPLVSLCGKGVCFDTGGYDLKPSAGMLRMKKDMAGAATALGLACMIIEADLPVRLALHLGCAENAVSGDAMRPMDVIATRRGLSVEVGNTDAEGRLVLCDLLAAAAEEQPALLIDFATLTGAARVALGPDLPALFSNDDAAAATVIAAAAAEHDFVYRLPLWNSYDLWLDSHVADLNNVSDKPQAGAIIAALFLQRFIPESCRWLHFDIYGWNDRSRPGRPEGGEAQAMRGVFAGLAAMFGTG